MSFVCAISGVAPAQPVVTKAGHLFEKSLIEKHLESESTCPVTKEPLTKDDLIALEPSKIVKVRPISATSVPSMIATFQNEWDALMIETFTLKQHLDTVRQELSHALYQHDAACRVIARLVKERDQARSQLTNLRKQFDLKETDGAMDIDSGSAATLPVTLPKETVTEMTTKAATLSKGRKALCKQRINSKGLTSADDIRAFDVVSSHNVHKSRPAPGINCVDVHPDKNKVVTGGADHQAVVFSRDGGVLSTLASHTDAVTATAFHPTNSSILTSSLDKTALLWTTTDEKDYSVAYTFDAHTAAVTGLSVHPLGTYFATSSMDRSWAVHDMNSGKAITQVKDNQSQYGYGCVEFHPDGVILATGQDKTVKIWEVKQCSNAFTFEDTKTGITDMSFSENGYYFATASNDGAVALWDLRKLKKFQTIEVDQPVSAVSFDTSGMYLAAGVGSSVHVYETKGWNNLMTNAAHTAAVSAVSFGPEAGYVCSTSADQALKFFAKA